MNSFTALLPRTLCVVSSIFILQCTASASLEQRAAGLERCANDLSGDIREQIMDSDRGNAQGESSQLYQNATSLRDAAARYNNLVQRNASNGSLNSALREVENQARDLRKRIAGQSYPYSTFENLWRVEGLIMAIKEDSGDAKKERRSREKVRASKPVATGRVVDEPAAEQAAAEVQPEPTGARIGFGNGQVTEANSIAHRHLHRVYSVSHEDMRTLDIKPKRDVYAVKMAANGTEYYLEVSLASQQVVKEKIRR